MNLRAKHISHPYMFGLLSDTPTILLAKWRSYHFFNQMYQNHLDLETWNLHRTFGMAQPNDVAIKSSQLDKASANLGLRDQKTKVLRCSKSESDAAWLSPACGIRQSELRTQSALKDNGDWRKGRFPTSVKRKTTQLTPWLDLNSHQFQDFQGFQFQLGLLELRVFFWYILA